MPETPAGRGDGIDRPAHRAGAWRAATATRATRGHAPERAASAAGRALAALVGLASALLAGWLALHHPLSPALALAGVVVLAGAQATWPPLWLIALPALLPWLGLGAWTGWLVTEEMDLAILAVAAGAYLRWALRPDRRVRAGPDSRGVRLWGRVLLVLWTASVLVAMHRGALGAGGWSWSWWQGLREPLNALRLAKPTLAVLLLLPLWWRLQQRPGQRCADQLGWGMSLMLAGITLWCVYERWAFTGLLNMAADYRTTGPFWETQTGGAALDISLALTLPFALRTAWRARHPAAIAASGAVVLGGVYAGLTSFSRIVFLALPVGALLLWLAQRYQPSPAATTAGAGPATASSPATRGGAAALALLGLGAAALGAWMFPTAGYRGLIALLGNLVVLLWLVPRCSGQPAAVWVGGWIGGLALAGLLGLVWLAWPKGAYLAYAGATALAAGALLLRGGQALATAASALAAAAFVAQLACTVLVAWHWGGPGTVPAAGTAAGLLALAWVVGGLRRTPPWPGGLGTVVRGGTAMVAVLGVVAVFAGGPFMAGRLQQTESDGAGRWQHWRDGLSLNRGGASGWLGEGLGRYADLYALGIRLENRPGDLRLVPRSDGAGPAAGPADGSTAAMVRMVAGNHMLGHGELIMLSQRVNGLPWVGLRVTVEVRADGPVQLMADVCWKHLLYDTACRPAVLKTTGGSRDWQTLSQPLPDNGEADDGIPRITVFSVASETRRPLELRRVSLTDASGREWLQNGDFADGGARWFISSDRNHLPWHAKNMAVHLLVEQGLLGLLAATGLTLSALFAVWGPLRRHPLAPALGAAIVGAWIVGSVDSVFDMPRVATWLLLLTAMALQLHLPRAALPGRSPAAGPLPAA